MNKVSGLKETLFSEVLVPVGKVKYISYNLPYDFVEIQFALSIDDGNSSYGIQYYSINPVYPLNGIVSNNINYAADSDQQILVFNIIPNAHHYLGLTLTVGNI